MKIARKYLCNGFALPVLGFGTWKMGGVRTRDPNNDDTRDIAAIRHALDAGMTHFDTAELYAGGYAETLLGKAIEGYDRSKLQIASKVRGDNCSYQAIIHACNNSLKRLGTDYLDLYYIHWREDIFDLQDCMQAMSDLVEQGKIKYIGVSNFSKETLKKAQEYARYPIVANQVQLSLSSRQAELSGLLDYCAKNNILVVAWRPFDYGNLANNPPKILQDISQKYDSNPGNIALSWVLSHKNVVALFQSRNPKHIDQNIAALSVNLSKEDREDLKNNFPDVQEISYVPLR